MSFFDWDHDDGDDDRSDWERLWVGLRDGHYLGREPGVVKRGLVSVNVGWLARGGLLRLREEGLDFDPSPLERLLAARPRFFRFDDIQRLERLPARAGEILPGGMTPRLRLHMGRRYPVDLLFPSETLDDWLPLIVNQRDVWERRRPFLEGAAGVA